MRLFLTPNALEDYHSLPLKLQKLALKQFQFLLKDIRYPSLKAKKYNEANDRWQARMNRDYRFYFFIEGDVYVIVAITKHPK